MRVQIGIDDLSPRPTQSFELWYNVERLLAAGLKVDLFVTFAMVRDGDGPYLLSKHPGFVEDLRQVSKLDGVALNVHGFHHSCGPTNNDEFFLLPEEHLKERLHFIDTMISEFGVDFKRVFRPPAWKISQEGVNLLVDHKYTHLSLVSGVPSYSKIYDDLDLSNIKVHWCNSSPPDIPLCDGDLATTYHFTTSLRNALTDKNVDELLSRIENPEPYHIFET